MKFHEYANLFPMMPEMDLMRLAEDIKEKGQSDPVVTLDGMILDGRNRFKACEMNGITPRCEAYTGDDPLGFVISHNLHRRHLDESQRGMVAAKLSNLSHGGQGGTLNPSIDGLKVSQSKAQEMLNVGESTVSRAKKIQREGVPELIAAVESGEVTVNAARHVAELPKEEQSALMAAGTDAVKAKAKEIRETPKKEEPKPEPKPDKPSKWIPDDARRLWLLAKTDLDKILKEDKSRETVLMEVIKYAQQRIDTQS